MTATPIPWESAENLLMGFLEFIEDAGPPDDEMVRDYLVQVTTVNDDSELVFVPDGADDRLHQRSVEIEAEHEAAIFHDTMCKLKAVDGALRKSGAA